MASRESRSDWDPDLARANALIRDEHRLRFAYAEATVRRFDVDTCRVLRDRVEDLLDTLTAVEQDDDFWDRLVTGGRPPTELQLGRLAELDTVAFAALLEAAGYVSPPPPPVDELVDDTIASLALAARAAGDSADSATRVRQGRWYLQTLLWRVRRQIEPSQRPQLTTSFLRSAARQLGGAARWLIPTVAAAAAGAIVEAHAPGTGAGAALGAAVERTAEKAATQAGEMLFRGDPVGPLDRAVPEEEWAARDPIAVHVTALLDQTDTIQRLVNATKDERRPEHLGNLVAIAQRHAHRLKEVLADGGYRDDSNVSAALADLLEALATVCAGTSGQSATLREAAGLSVQAARFLKGQLEPV